MHLCERKHNKRKIVIKRINMDLNREGVELAKNEVAVLKSLNHPNIIQFYDSYVKDGTLYIVMEYANKGTLHEFIARTKPDRLHPQVRKVFL